MTKWWLISDEDVKKIVDGLVIAPGKDWWGPNGDQRQQAFFDDLEHTLHSGLHETDAVPQPIVTVHADPSMRPETAAAFGEMTRLAVEMVRAQASPASADAVAALEGLIGRYREQATYIKGEIGATYDRNANDIEDILENCAAPAGDRAVEIYRAALENCEQGSLEQGRREGIWMCGECGVESTMRHAIHHDDDCVFACLVSIDAALAEHGGKVAE